MKSPNLKRSIVFVILLVLVVIAYHISSLYEMNGTWLAVGFLMLMLTMNVIYFIQLRNNLRAYLNITNINYPVYSIIIANVVTYILTIMVIIIQLAGLNEDRYLQEFGYFIFVIAMISYVFMLVHYPVLGYRLQKYSAFPLVRMVGLLYLFLNPISNIVTFVFQCFDSLKIYSNFSIISELLPLLIVCKLYRGLIAKGNMNERDALITNTGVLSRDGDANGPTEFTA